MEVRLSCPPLKSYFSRGRLCYSFLALLVERSRRPQIVRLLTFKNFAAHRKSILMVSL